MQVKKQPRAEQDIEDIFVFIAQQNIYAGLNFLAEIANSFITIANNPFIGAKRDSNVSKLLDVRIWPVKSYEKYLIYYNTQNSVIEIIRVIHSSARYPI